VEILGWSLDVFLTLNTFVKQAVENTVYLHSA